MSPVIHHSRLVYPILKFGEDGTPKKINELYEYIVKTLEIPKEKTEIMVRDTRGRSPEPVYQHDIRNKMTVLKDNGLIEKINTGEYKITPSGIEKLKNLGIKKGVKITNLTNTITKGYPPIHFFLRFKDTDFKGKNLQINTFEEHNKLLQKNNVVWWGNDGRSIREDILIKIINQIRKNIKTKVYLYGTRSNDWYLGILSDISNKKPSDTQNIPEYYREDICKSYFKFSDLTKLNTKAIPRHIQNPLVYVYEKNGEGLEYIHVIKTDLPIIESSERKLNEKFTSINKGKSSYFILRTGFDDYPDFEQNYTFKGGIKYSNQLIEAANNAKFIYLEEAKFYAIGDIGDVTKDTISNEILYKAKIQNPQKIDPIDSDFDFKLPRTRITPITKEQYDSILSKRIFDISTLDSITHKIDISSFEINSLYFNENQKKRMVQQITSAIKNNKHLILIGPPGTGKSKLAKIICEAYGLSTDEYTMCTATSDWSTFDTIGGYRPNPKNNGDLEFSPGIFMQCFQDKKFNPINKWLILDEINRADIDKAFGSLFSALTGDTITIPFERKGNEIKIVGSYKDDFKGNNETFIIHKTWRLIATMNNFDKSSLYQMSYAFMRRFAFIDVEVPIKIDEDIIREYVKIWKLRKEDGIILNLSRLWKEINETRKIGPSIIEDMYRYLLSTNSLNTPAYTDTINMYVIPQFEGLEENKIINFVNTLIKTGIIDQPDILKQFTSDFFGIAIQQFK